MIPADIDLDIEKIKHIFSNLRDGVALADARLDSFPLIYVNHSFERISGYTFDEINGKNCKFLQGKDTDLEHVQLIRNALKQQRSILVTILNYRNNGETFWNELSISPLLDSRGVAKYFISIQKDVTERI
jgi:PAS domain S-box-containing protein